LGLTLPGSRLVLAAFAGLLFGLAGCADVGDISGSRSTLWRIQGEHNVVYLLGSVHILPSSAYPLKPALQRAFDQSQRVVFEINLARVTSRNVTEEFKRTGFYPPDETLAEHVSPGTSAILRRTLPRLGISWESVQPLRPWFLAELVSSRYLETMGFHADLGVDEYFYRQARARRKEIQGLETLRDQAHILTGFTDRQSEEYLRSTLAGLPAYSALLSVVITAWQNGQIDLLDRLLNQNERSDPRAFRLLFADRNAKWLPAIEGFTHNRENVLVVVGTGHLVGSDGVVETLRRRGYNVQQL
jgi:uncharacterized protein YbaP (TraB family)